MDDLKDARSTVGCEDSVVYVTPVIGFIELIIDIVRCCCVVFRLFVKTAKRNLRESSEPTTRKYENIFL